MSVMGSTVFLVILVSLAQLLADCVNPEVKEPDAHVSCNAEICWIPGPLDHRYTFSASQPVILSTTECTEPRCVIGIESEKKLINFGRGYVSLSMLYLF